MNSRIKGGGHRQLDRSGHTSPQIYRQPSTRRDYQYPPHQYPPNPWNVGAYGDRINYQNYHSRPASPPIYGQSPPQYLQHQYLPNTGNSGAFSSRLNYGNNHSRPTSPPISKRPYPGIEYQYPQQQYPPPNAVNPAFYGKHQRPRVGVMSGGTFLGASLGTVLGDAVPSRMYEGRNPNTGEWEDPRVPDYNPCKRELDFYLQCVKQSENKSYCKTAGENLKMCANKYKDYFGGR